MNSGGEWANLLTVDSECCKNSNRERDCGHLPCLGNFFLFKKLIRVLNVALKDG